MHPTEIVLYVMLFSAFGFLFAVIAGAVWEHQKKARSDRKTLSEEERDRLEVKDKLSGPSLALICLSLLSIAFDALAVFTTPVLFLIVLVGNLICNVFILRGAICMRNQESYSKAFNAVILSVIPLLSPLYWFGIPFGIWALVVLSMPKVKASFHEPNDDGENRMNSSSQSAASAWESKKLAKRVEVLRQLAQGEGLDKRAQQLFEATGETPIPYLQSTPTMLKSEVAKSTGERKFAVEGLLSKAKTYRDEIKYRESNANAGSVVGSDSQIHLHCRYCGMRLKADRKHAGKRASFPKCKHLLEIPLPL
ncbi:MAG: hypothetical protein JW829_19355 [Pirellulales bacterium]|nr:hypothetical protein [Pirellulales bacterium]